MEGAGAAASVIAVLQITASVIHIISKYIRGVKGATKSAERLRKELRGFRGILEEVEEHGDVQRADGGAGAEMKFWKSIEEPLKDCKLMLTCLMNKLSTSGGKKTLGKALAWPFREKEFQEMVTSIGSFKQTFLLALSLDSTALVKDTWQDVKRMTSVEDRKYRTNVLKWLDTINVQLNHSSAREKHLEDTGMWFLNGADFAHWQASPRGLLWLFGIPGCGKSVLSSSVIESLQARTTEDNQSPTAVAYFYFDFADEENRTVPNLLSTLLAQLCKQIEEIPSSVRTLYDSYSHQAQCSLPPSGELLDTLMAVARRWPYIYIMVDALDECKVERREKLLSVLSDLCSTDVDVRLAVTSRPEHDIKQFLDERADTSVCLQSDKVDQDIILYVQSILQKDVKMRQWPSADRQTVEQTLIHKAQGMFRWVFCQLETLRKCMNRVALQKALHSLPKTLDQTYERILVGIEEEYKQQAYVALHWLAFSRRPLKVGELAEAVAIDSGKPDCNVFNVDGRLFKSELILEICSSLISVSGTGPRAKVRLAHFSIQEYLVSDRIPHSYAASFALSQLRADQIITEFCISYMLNNFMHLSFEDYRDPFVCYSLCARIPFLAYAVEFWYQHANSSVIHTACMSELIKELISEKEDSLRMRQWWKLLIGLNKIQRYRHLQNPKTLGGTIAYAANLGLEREVKMILRDSAPLDRRADMLEAALYAAASGKHIKLVEMLLEEGATPNARGSKFGNALDAAVKSRDASIVATLLNGGADPNIESRPSGRVLSAAACEGSKEVIELLLKAGAEVNPKTITCLSKLTPLENAICSGKTSIVKLLLEAGAKVDPKTTACLSAAIKSGNPSIVKLLLDSGADPNAAGQYGSLLRLAVHNGHKEIVDILLPYGPKLDLHDDDFNEALQAADPCITEEVVDCLLYRDHDIRFVHFSKMRFQKLVRSWMESL